MAKDFKAAIRERAKELGIDLIGFAGPERFHDACGVAILPPGRDPFKIFPEAKTVILVGRLIPRGALRGAEEGTTFASYGNFGCRMLDDQFNAATTYDLVRFIEDAGYEACPIFPNPDAINNMGVPVEPDRPAPNVAPDFDYAAVACGLGEIGLSGQFLSPEFGHRQRFQMIITDAELGSDPLYSGEKLCNQCGACISGCPLGALSVENTKIRVICGKTFPVAELDKKLCESCLNGGTANRLHPKGDPDRMAAACNRACVRALSERGIGRMKSEFKAEKSWAKDRQGRLV